MITYKVRAYTVSKLKFVYAVKAENSQDARDAVKLHLQRFGIKVKRTYANLELDGILNAKDILPF